MLTRKQLLITAFAFMVTPGATLTSCDSDSATQTVQDIIDTIKKTCSFTTTAEMLLPIILTVVSTVNATAGAAATVAASVAKQVTDLVCAAVKQQVAQNKALKKAGPAAAANGNQITIVVNGKEITGEYTGG